MVVVPFLMMEERSIRSLSVLQATTVLDYQILMVEWGSQRSTLVSLY